MHRPPTNGLPFVHVIAGVQFLENGKKRMSTVQSSVQLFPAPFSMDPACKVVVDSKCVGCAAVDHHGAFAKALVVDVILHALVDWEANVSP